MTGRWGALVAAFLLFAIFGWSAEPGTTVTFWHAMDGARGKALQNLVDEFNATHPELRVQAEFKGTDQPYANHYKDLLRALLTALRASRPPTMSQLYENWTLQFVGADVLVPMERFVKEDGYEGQLADFVPAFLSANRFQETLWTLPFNKSLYVLYYNRDLFEHKGLTPPATWTQLEKTAKILTRLDAKGKPTRYGFAHAPDVDLFGLMLYAIGGNYFKENRADFNGPLGQSALRLMFRMSRQRVFLPDYEWLKHFRDGNVAMTVDTTSKLPYFQGISSFRVGLARVPGNVSLFAGTNLGIFKQASPEEQKGAWIFIKWLLEPRHVARWSVETGYLPVRRSALNEPLFQDYLKRDSRLKVALDQMDRAFTDPRVGAWESIRGFVDEGVERVINGKTGIQEALNQAARETNLLLK